MGRTPRTHKDENRNHTLEDFQELSFFIADYKLLPEVARNNQQTSGLKSARENLRRPYEARS
jgi:hypothetical protein